MGLTSDWWAAVVEDGRGEPLYPELRWGSSRDVQGHPEEDPSHSVVEADRGAGKLRSGAQRILLRPAPGSICSNSKLLQVSFTTTSYYQKIRSVRRVVYVRTN